MSTDHGLPYSGPLSFDLTALANLLVDQPSGATRGMCRDQPGITDVIHELADAMPAHGAAAGVSKEVYLRFLDSTAKLDLLRQHSAAILKIAEVLGETEATFENQRELALGQIIDAVKSTAKRTRNQAIVAPFEKAIRYRLQASDKAMRTRKQKAAQKIETKKAAEPSSVSA